MTEQPYPTPISTALILPEDEQEGRIVLGWNTEGAFWEEVYAEDVTPEHYSFWLPMPPDPEPSVVCIATTYNNTEAAP